MRVLDLIAMVAFPLALIVAPFSFYNFHRRPISSALIFAVPLMICFTTCDLSEAIVRGQVLGNFDLLSADYQISVDGKRHPNPPEALAGLKTLRWIPAHHSYPAKRMRVAVSDGSRQVDLEIARDSREPHEYWVFCPSHFITRHNEVGRIVTSAFDNY
jgi:hypothetical protein